MGYDRTNEADWQRKAQEADIQRNWVRQQMQDAAQAPMAPGPYSGTVGLVSEATKPAQLARELIGDLARSQRTAAHELEALLRALPAELPPEADRALYHLVERGMVRR